MVFCVAVAFTSVSLAIQIISHEIAVRKVRRTVIGPIPNHVGPDVFMSYVQPRSDALKPEINAQIGSSTSRGTNRNAHGI